jgi:hypothetical protein
MVSLGVKYLLKSKKKIIMKKVITTLLVTASLAATAQQQTLCYNYENSAFVQITSTAKEGHILEAYSTPSGGHLLQKLQVSAGLQVYKFDRAQCPAMLVNRRSTENPSGDNMVYQLQKEFSVVHVNIANTEDLTISFQAYTAHGAIFKLNINGVQVAEQSTSAGQAQVLLASNASQIHAMAIDVFSLQGVKLASLPVAIPHTVCSYGSIYASAQNATITLREFINDESSVIYDASGKQIQLVTLTGLHTTIDISNLSSGSYFLRFSNGYTKQFFKP